MATENHWRARKIQAELSKLGIEVSLATISRYLPKSQTRSGYSPALAHLPAESPGRDRGNGLLRRADGPLPSSLRLVRDRSRATPDPPLQRDREPDRSVGPPAATKGLPDEPAHRFLIFDNDAIFSVEVARSIAGFGIRPTRTALRSPWQNGTAERFVGTVRRELLDHVVVLSEEHLRRLLREYIAYYNAERVHTSIGDSGGPRRRSQAVGTRRGSHDCRAWVDSTEDTRGARLREQLSRLVTIGFGVRMNFDYRQGFARVPE